MSKKQAKPTSQNAAKQEYIDAAQQYAQMYFAKNLAPIFVRWSECVVQTLIEDGMEPEHAISLVTKAMDYYKQSQENMARIEQG